MSDTWHYACRVDELVPDEGRRLSTTPPIAVFLLDGEVFATADTCTHSDSSLSDGYVEPDGSVECVAHMARFCIRTGRVLAPPATAPLPTFQVRVEDGDVYVRVE